MIIATAVVWAGRLLINAYPVIGLGWFALIALPVAWAFFILRVFQRSIYGFVEVVIGVFTVTNTYNIGFMSDPKTLLTLAAGIYVVVRGLDNIDQGLNHYCATFLNRDDAFACTFYWEVGVKGRFLSGKLKRGVYLKMVRPLFKQLWAEFEQLNCGTDKDAWETPYWWARKHHVLALMNERAVRLCRSERHLSRGSQPTSAPLDWL
ncbi:hypothetical protein AYJ54_17890 [Bradyrhizobium centrolobii]|uniref:Uncharacterized protein n=1 Tax=Bradyrhizobium centrolobii TaxID=1505087 RepID=A0A176YLZ5_9BRAD|nr:hypothetical protein AYJ54_17890 [Bradyrhizobium centrolobii]